MIEDNIKSKMDKFYPKSTQLPTNQRQTKHVALHKPLVVSSYNPSLS